MTVIDGNNIVLPEDGYRWGDIVLDPNTNRLVREPPYMLKSFSSICRKVTAAHGEFRTKRVILETHDARDNASEPAFRTRQELIPRPPMRAQHMNRSRFDERKSGAVQRVAMADWKDFYEDNKEFLGQYLDSMSKRKGSNGIEKAPPTPPLQFCPLCHAAFFEDGEIAIHIRAVHGPQHVYLRVNGQIIRDIGWAEQGVSELRLVLLGFSHATIELAGSQLQRTFTVDSAEDLKRWIPASYEGELTLRVEPAGGTAREFTIYSRAVPQFRGSSLDDLIVSWSDRYTKPGGTPDIGRWRELTGDMGILENRYLNGFFEYALAFHLSNNGQSEKSKQHFEDAFGLLLPFRTPLAHSAQCVPWTEDELFRSSSPGAQAVFDFSVGRILQPTLPLAGGAPAIRRRDQSVYDVRR